jgi:alkylhydroperoxidase family enzyme
LGYGLSMGRLPLVDSEDPDADPLARDALRASVGGGSIAPNVFRALANHPRALEVMARFGSVVYFNNSLTPAQRELTYLTASVTNDCHY